MMNSKHIYGLLLAGGSGERLWPLSRRHKPKQFLALEHHTLLEEAVARMHSLTRPENIWVVTTQLQSSALQDLIGDLVGFISVEPMARNTAAAITLNAFAIHSLDPDALLVVMPTDHHIPQHELFTEFMMHAIDSAHTVSGMVALGIKPTYPATGFGYIECVMGESYPLKVQHFHEKPSEEIAKEYLHRSTMLWNTGIFCAPVAVLLQEIEEHAPVIYEAVKKYWLYNEPYENIPAQSIDCAVMEKSSRLWALPASLVWNDVGNLNSFLSLHDGFKKNNPEIIAIDAHDNLVEVENKLVALVGVENLCIVQADDILLVAHRDQTEKVKLVLDTLKLNNSDEYL